MTNEKQQIDGIVKILCKFKNEPYTESDCKNCVFENTCYYKYIAKEIYNAGYRKGDEK